MNYQPRICVCVVMNHPFPQNIPIIRRLYRGRFSKVVFVMPFERSDDPDVFTAYRGSYNHSAYITDVREKLAAIECDYFIIVHDDVLLNPTLSEATFLDRFPLAPDDGFIAQVDPPGEHVGHDPSYLGVVAKMLFPKSQIFGAGMDAANMVKYLPPIDQLRAKLAAAGIAYKETVRLDHEDFARIDLEGSRILLHGHAVNVEVHPTAEQNRQACVDIIHQLIDAMALGIEIEPPKGRLERGLKDQGREVVLPFPITCCGPHGDFYILPRSKLNDYAHYAGVWSGTGAMIEYSISTLLCAVCDRVWTSKQLDLEFSFFASKRSIGYFENPKFIGIHPYKLSQYGDSEGRENFFGAMDDIVRGGAWPQLAQSGRGFRLNDLIGDFSALGWNGSESWGRWAAKERATVPFKTSAERPIAGAVLKLISPLGPGVAYTGSVGVNGKPPRRVAIEPSGNPFEFVIEGSELEPNGVNEVEIVSDRIVRQIELAPGNSTDTRPMGFGLISLDFL